MHALTLGDGGGGRGPRSTRSSRTDELILSLVVFGILFFL